MLISWPVCLFPQSHSSQSSDRQSLACLQSDSSNSSTQVTTADRTLSSGLDKTCLPFENILTCVILCIAKTKHTMFSGQQIQLPSAPLRLLLDIVLWSDLLPCGLFSQVFESIEEVEQIETEPKSEEVKQGPKITNGAVQNGTSSPDSGHPSSRNFSVTSVLSDGSLSTEDNAVPDTAPRTGSVFQSPIKPAGAKAEVPPEESLECKPRDQKEEEEEEEEATSAAQAMAAPSLEKKMEEESKKPDSVEESGAIEAKEMLDQKTNQPPQVLLAKREELISEAQAADAEKSLLFPAHSGTQSSSKTNFTPQRDGAQVMTESDESPPAIEMEEIPKAKVSVVPWSRKGRCEALPLPDDAHVLLRQGKVSPEGTESLLSDEPEFQTTSQIAGTPFTVRTCVLLVFTGFIFALLFLLLSFSKSF